MITPEEFEKLCKELNEDIEGRGIMESVRRWDEWWEVQTPAFQKAFDDAMKEAAYELRTDGENYKFVKQEAYVKDVELLDG